jgi:hypothetical protein
MSNQESSPGVVPSPRPFPFAAWHEDEHDVLWWRFPICEPPYVGSPLCSDWPFDAGDEEALKWTRFIVPDGVPSPRGRAGETIAAEGPLVDSVETLLRLIVECKNHPACPYCVRNAAAILARVRELEQQNAGLHLLLADFHAVSECNDAELLDRVEKALGSDMDGDCGNRFCRELSLAEATVRELEQALASHCVQCPQCHAAILDSRIENAPLIKVDQALEARDAARDPE